MTTPNSVASLNLCKELYELSGWDDVGYGWFKYGKHLSGDKEVWDIGREAISEFPAYDLGYLLRKIVETSYPGKTIDIRYNHPEQMLATAPREWIGKYTASFADMRQGDYPYADTPEDALCKLALELIKQGILMPTNNGAWYHRLYWSIKKGLRP